MSEGAPPTREELEARWQVLWAQGEELTARHERLLASLRTVEESIGLKALEQLREDQAVYKREMERLRADMERNGGFK